MCVCVCGPKWRDEGGCDASSVHYAGSRLVLGHRIPGPPIQRAWVKDNYYLSILTSVSLLKYFHQATTWPWALRSDTLTLAQNDVTWRILHARPSTSKVNKESPRAVPLHRGPDCHGSAMTHIGDLIVMGVL